MLSRSATREATRVYQFITNNHANNRLTCGKRKICSTMKKSQNIINMIFDSVVDQQRRIQNSAKHVRYELFLKTLHLKCLTGSKHFLNSIFKVLFSN